MSYIVRKPICAFEEWEAKKEEGADLFSARVTIADYCAEKNQHYCNIKDFFYRDAVRTLIRRNANDSYRQSEITGKSTIPRLRHMIRSRFTMITATIVMHYVTYV